MLRIALASLAAIEGLALVILTKAKVNALASKSDVPVSGVHAVPVLSNRFFDLACTRPVLVSA
jgi:hypothetical protein